MPSVPRHCMNKPVCRESRVCSHWRETNQTCWPTKIRHSAYMRHTMGQDWGGRESANSKGALTTTEKDVREIADAMEIKVRREVPGSWSVWLVRGPDGREWVLGSTNHQAYLRLKANDASGWPWERG